MARRLIVFVLVASSAVAVGGGSGFAADFCAPRSVNVSDAGWSEGGPSDGGTLNFTVLTSGCAGGTVQYQTVAGVPGLSAATAAVDYVVSSGQLSWVAGDTTGQTISVSIVGDTDPEPDEGLTLELFNPVGLLVFDGSGIGTIVDDDTVTFDLTTDSRPFCYENCVSCWLSVVASAPVPVDVTVHFGTRDGTARAGADYTAVAGKVVIPAGATRVAFSVPIIDDPQAEHDEYLYVSISKLSTGRIRNGTVTMVIVDEGLSR